MVIEMMFSNIDLVSNDISSGALKIKDDFLNELREYNEQSKMNHFNKEEYRERMNRLYNDIDMIKPIDSEINGIIYFDDYNEVGIVVNKSDISLKQAWTEYRLIYNEKNSGEECVMENSFVLDNFDELFDRISKKVDGLDKHIGDLNSLKKEIDINNSKLKSEKENLEIERVTFENYKREEMSRLSMLEKELNNKMEKIESLVKVINDKLKDVDF